MSLEAILIRVIATSSFLHTILPPWEVFNDFPRVQKVYKVVVYTVGYLALNARSTLWQQISAPKQIEKAVEKVSTTTVVADVQIVQKPKEDI